MNEASKIPAITHLIEDGYMPGMLRTIIETLRWKASSLEAENLISQSEAADIWNLLLLEEAILKDCFNIEINSL